MKKNILEFLSCPNCKSDLKLEIFEEVNNIVINGLFLCSRCGKKYPVIQGIPRFVSLDMYKNSESFKRFYHVYKEDLEFLDLDEDFNATSPDNVNYEIKLKTVKYFGYEWSRFINWGWIKEEEIPEEERIKYHGGFINNTISSFKKKSLMDESNLSVGKLVLDAGCGNGRYSNQAAGYGAEVIGVDIGTGTVEAAYENTKKKENIHIIQGDLFKLPFKKGIFDTVFSIGVLMHTGGACKAFRSIAGHVKAGGVFTAHLYHKLNPVWEMNDFLIRKITTNMSVEKNVEFAGFMSRLGRILAKMKLIKIANLFIRVQPTLIHMYDWYSAPVATHHTYDEAKKWYLENDFEVVKTNESYPYSPFFKPWSLTVKGKKI